MLAAPPPQQNLDRQAPSHFMNQKYTKHMQSKFPEWMHAALALAIVALLFGACAAVPFVLGHHLGVWFGLLGAFVAIVCWLYLVRPMPGLGAGLIALLGLGALLGLLISWMIKVIHHIST
jgi:FtsH-binding integral membrane protein